MFVVAACGGKSGGNPPPVDATADAAIEPPPHRCDFADCEAGFARTCGSDPQTLDCSQFGASCGAFTDTESGEPFRWCSCGNLAEGEGFCLGGRFGVTCLDGLGGLADCGVGFVCAERPNGPFGIGCDCNNASDGICPSISCGADPDCAQCTPSCSGRQCGDNGCGGECGQCDLGDECTPQGTCVKTCVPDCTNKQCGDDGCGGTCGSCDGTCSADGQCQGACVPSCTKSDGSMKVCGSDGCGGSCGSCASDLTCNLEGACDCDFFDKLEYKFTLAPQAGFPASFTFVAINVLHTGIDGETRRDGAFLGFRATDKQSFVFPVFGCRPNLEIKLEYALSGDSCTFEQTVTTKTDFVIQPPVLAADGSCTVPPP